MLSKVFEVRDRMTFIPVLAIELRPDERLNWEKLNAQAWLLRRSGYGPAPRGTFIMLTRLDASAMQAIDAHEWGDRTFSVAHDFIQKNWMSLSDGEVIDVEFILKESTEKKISERFALPVH